MPQQPPMICLLISDHIERLHTALALAATAAAGGRAVVLYLTGPAVHVWVQDGLHMLSHSDGRTLADVTTLQEAKGLPDLAMLLDALSAMPVEIVICDSALREAGIDAANLRTHPKAEISGYASLLVRASDLQQQTGLAPNWLSF